MQSEIGYTGKKPKSKYINDNGHQSLAIREEIYKYVNSESSLTSVVLGWTWRHWCELLIFTRTKEIQINVIMCVLIHTYIF